MSPKKVNVEEDEPEAEDVEVAEQDDSGAEGSEDSVTSEEESEDAADEDSGDDAEEEKEEEAEEEAPRPRRKGAHGSTKARRKGHVEDEDAPKPKTKLWAVIIAVIILVPVVGAVYFYYGPAGSIKRIDLFVSPVLGTSYQFNVNIDTGKPSKISGEADLFITRAGTNVYTGKMPISESTGSKTVNYRDFVTGNGDYNVALQFQDQRATKSINITTIVEMMNVSANPINNTANPSVPVGTTRINVLVVFLDNRYITQRAVTGDVLDIEITKVGMAATKYTETVNGKAQFSKTYPADGGNYTVKATLTNSRLKAGSEAATITMDAHDSITGGSTIFVNIPPTAEAGQNQTVRYNPLELGVTVNFDGSNSKDYDGTLVKYQWDFGDQLSAEPSAEGVKVSHKYTSRSSYTVTLTVVDNDGEIASDDIVVIVN